MVIQRPEYKPAQPVESLGKAVNNAIDPYGVTTSLLNAQMAWLMHPQKELTTRP
ncbi:MAG: hypothetical protein IPF44_11575 [Betaproteobacteria bacterium]|nr:hypothetical protein [Betaproteobacteria bacterium]